MVDLRGFYRNTLSHKYQRSGLLLLALPLIVTLFSYQFFYEGGREFVNPDGQHYLAMARGEKVVQPFNTRIVGPLMASLISALTGISNQTAFQLMTSICILGALLLLFNLLKSHNASASFQVAVIIALGSALATLFGFEPVLVDSLLLFIVCLFIKAIDYQKYVLALVIVCIAALTKEYGAFLVIPWALQRVRERRMHLAAWAIAPFILIVLAKVIFPGESNDLFHMVTYQIRTIQENGLMKYLKFAYVWAWGALWPILFLAIYSLIVARVKGLPLSKDQRNFSAMLASLPVILIGDWDRTFIVLTPFACVTAASTRLAQKPQYNFILTVGGLATALARRFKVETMMPPSAILAMIIISVASSIMLIIAGFRQIRPASI